MTKLCSLQGGEQLSTSSLIFENNYALNPDVTGMPAKDVTVEFWTRTPAYNKSSANADKKFEDLLNYATHIPEDEGSLSSEHIVAVERRLFAVEVFSMIIAKLIQDSWSDLPGNSLTFLMT